MDQNHIKIELNKIHFLFTTTTTKNNKDDNINKMGGGGGGGGGVTGGGGGGNEIKENGFTLNRNKFNQGTTQAK